MIDLQEKKNCNYCKQDLPLDRFSPGRKPGTTRCQCKSCASSYQKKKYREDNPIVKKLSSKQQIANGEVTRRCNKCLVIKPISFFEKRRKSEGRVMSYCKECEKHIDKDYRDTVSGKFSIYKRKAKSRNISFSLTLEEFSLLWQIPCTYCGIDIKTCGIDRINSSSGYTPNNIVSCCEQCNFGKLNHSLEYFISQIKKLYLNIDSIKLNQKIRFDSKFNDSSKFENRKYQKYYHSAIERNIPWNLSKSEFFSLWGLPCHYCLSDISTIGVDRINNCEGYVTGNIVPCCQSCNKMKLDYSIDEFSVWIERAYKNLYFKNFIIETKT